MEFVAPAPRIPDYELLRLIGNGSYGDVWLGRGVTGVFRAIKFVRRDRFRELRPYEREFEGITRFASVSLREPSQLALLHVGRREGENYFYYVMELADDAVRGREIDPESYTPLTLKEFAMTRTPVAPDDVVALGVTLARAVGSLHAAGLVHRDIKPSNIIFVGGVPKLADVGLVAAASAGLTFVGTEGFVPPEGPGAPAADVYSLGKVLYEIATGLDRNDWPRLPSDLATRPDRARLIELNEVLLRACEANPARRFPDAPAMLDELLLLQAGKSVRKLRAAERRLTRTLRVAAVLALIAGIASAGAYVERQRADEEMRRRAAVEAERDALLQRKIYANTLGNVRHHIEREEFGQARLLLDEAKPAANQPDLRAFEWYALQREAQGDPSVLIRPEGHAIDRLAVSPDERWLAAHGTTAVVTLYDLSTRQPVRTVGDIQTLGGFSSDGQWLVGSNKGGSLQRWRVADGSAENTSPTGMKLRALGSQGPDQAVALEEGASVTLVVWDFLRQAEVMRVPVIASGATPRWEFFRGGVDPAGQQVALAFIQGRGSQAQFQIIAVDLTGTTPRVSQAAIPSRPGAVGVDGAGAWAAIDDTGAIWRIGKDGWQKESEPLVRGIRRMVPLLSVPGGHLAIDRDRLHWLDAQGRMTRQGRGHQGILGDVVALSGSGWVYSSSHSGEIRAWPAAVGDESMNGRQIWNSRGGATRAIFSPDSNRLVVPLNGRDSGILDLATFAQVQTVPGMLYPLQWTGDIVTGIAADSGLVSYSLTHRREVRRGLAAVHPLFQGLVSADGLVYAATDQEGTLWVENEKQPGVTTKIPGDYQNWFTLVADTRAGKLWASGSRNRLRCQSLPDGRELWTANLPALAPFLRLMPGDRQLLVPLENARLELRDALTGALLKSVATGGSPPQSIVPSHDGRRVFIAGSRGDIVCLDTTDWVSLGVFQLPGEPALHYLGISPDDRTLVAITKTGELHLVRSRPRNPPQHPQ